MPPVAAAAAALLEECGAFVRSAGPGAYAGVSRVLEGGSIGKHIRHSLDHFRAALDGLRPGGVVDYDRRERNVPMETDPEAAMAAIEGLRLRLLEIGEAELERPLRVRVMLSGAGQQAELTSTLGRELAFAAHHAVHHHAMVRAIAVEFGVRIGGQFGVAPSTVNHERTRSGPA